MKKFFTLVACALCASVSVNAQTVQVAIEKSVLVTEMQDVKDADGNPTGEQKEVAKSCNGEVVLSDNECFTATTVFASTAGTNNYTYPDGLVFTDWIQLRVAADPSEDNPTGTDNAGSTPVVIVAKQNATFSAYVRTGSNKNCNLFDQSTFTALDGTNTAEADESSSSNSFFVWTWTIEAGKTYVLTERGGTGRLSGFSYVLGGGAGGDDTSVNGVTVNAANADAPAYNLAGQKVNDTFKGVVVKNGKKIVRK